MVVIWPDFEKTTHRLIEFAHSKSASSFVLTVCAASCEPGALCRGSLDITMDNEDSQSFTYVVKILVKP